MKQDDPRCQLKVLSGETIQCDSWIAHGRLCSNYLSSGYCVEIQATNLYCTAMEVARVVDLAGSGQLTISGFELL
jgi:hypothetical protein